MSHYISLFTYTITPSLSFWRQTLSHFKWIESIDIADQYIQLSKIYDRGGGAGQQALSEGANFDNETYPMQFEAYNRYVCCYFWGLEACPQEKIS